MSHFTVAMMTGHNKTHTDTGACRRSWPEDALGGAEDAASSGLGTVQKAAQKLSDANSRGKVRQAGRR